jgi:adenylosuccinate lyase
MREIWGEFHTRLLWREIWASLAEVQTGYELVTDEQAAEIRSKVEDIDLDLSSEVEEIIQHDLMAELEVFAKQCPTAGGTLHLGATSMDIKDNAVIIQQKTALKLILEELLKLLEVLTGLIDRWADLPVIGFTHLQPAEPTTLGYRLAQPAQDLLAYYLELKGLEEGLKGKGFSGAVGTSASFATLIGVDNLVDFQSGLAKKLGFVFFDVVTQTYPRIQDYQVLTSLSGLGAILYKMAFDLRILQSPVYSELAEPFGENQVGSSAMPFKQNPIKAEKINSLGRYLAQLPRIAWDNAAHSLLERTLDDSANRRTILPEAFLAAEEMLQVCSEIFSDLQVFENGIKQNLEDYGPFAATEKLLMVLARAGADRLKMHQVLRKHALQAWSAVREGKSNPMIELVSTDPNLLEFITKKEISRAMEGSAYLGDAAERAKNLSDKIKIEISG